jgi:MFS family permease
VVAARATCRHGRPSSAQILLFYVSCGFPITLWTMANFLVPLRAREVGAPLEIIGLLVAAGSVLGTIGAVPAGALADAIGTRRAFILGALLSAVGAFAMALTDNLWAMLAIQLYRGFPHSVSWVASQTYATGIGSPEDRATITGRFSFATSVSSLLSPLAMGAVAQYAGYTAAFVFVGGFALLHVFAGLLLPEPHPARKASSSGAGLGGFAEASRQLRERPTQVALLLTFVRIWITSGWMSFFPVYLKSQGLSDLWIGTVVTANGVVSALTALTAQWWARRAGNEIATAGALGLGTVGMALAPHLPLLPLVYLPALFMGTGTGLSMPLVMAILGNAVPPERRGVAMGLRTTANQAASVVAPVAIGLLVTTAGLPTGFLISGAAGLAMLGGALSMHFSARRTPAD